MSTAADDQFYREYILDHYKNPRNYGRLEHADITHEEDNPLCGDVVGMVAENCNLEVTVPNVLVTVTPRLFKV